MNSILVERRKGCSDVCIAFSARDTAPGKFTFFNVLRDLPAHVIFVNDHANNWYLNGTPEFPDQGAFLRHIHSLLSDLRGKNGRLFTLGSSMGAYAALNYGSMLQADRVLALGPESELCIPLGRSVSSMLQHAEGDADISGLAYREPGNVLIISGNNDIVDMYCASRFLTGNPELNVRLVTNRTHVVAKYLDANFGLATIVRDFFGHGNLEFLDRCELSAVPALDAARALKKFNEALSLRKEVLTELAAPIRALADAMPDWSMPPYFYGLIAEAEGQLDVSEQYLQRAVTAQRSLGRAVLKLARIRHADGRHQQALEGLRELARTNNTWSVTELMSQVLQSLGQPLQAMQVLRAFDRSLLKAPEQVRLDKRLNDLAQKFFSAASAVRNLRVTDLAAFPPQARHGPGTEFSNSSLELVDASAQFECGKDCSIRNASIRLGSDARFIVGDGCRISGEFVVAAGATVRVGCSLQTLLPVHVQAAAGTTIQIGDDCRFSGAALRSGHDYQLVDEGGAPEPAVAGDIAVGDRVCLNERCLLLPGTLLGDDTVVEYGAVVNLQLPEGHCVLAGSPAAIVRRGIRWTAAAVAGPLQLPPELNPALAALHRDTPQWIIERALPLLPLYRQADASNAWLFTALVRALLQRAADSKAPDRAPALDLPLLLDVTRHCNALQNNGERAGLEAQRAVLEALGDQEQAAVLSWLLANRWQA